MLVMMHECRIMGGSSETLDRHNLITQGATLSQALKTLTVRCLGLDGLAIRCDEHAGHEAQGSETLSDDIAADAKEAAHTVRLPAYWNEPLCNFVSKQV